MKFFSTGEHALANGIKVCVYGNTAVGKTRLIATAPRPYILSVEGGTLSIARENIKGQVITSLKDLIDAYTWIISSTEARNYDTICLDSISEMAEIFLANGLTTLKDGRAAYGEMQTQLGTQVRLFRDLPGKHVYFTAKAATKKQPDGTELYTASLPGQTASQSIPYPFDEFFYMGVAEAPGADGKLIRYNYLQTSRDVRYEAKDRSGALDFIERPDLSYIFNKIRAFYSVRI